MSQSLLHAHAPKHVQKYARLLSFLLLVLSSLLTPRTGAAQDTMPGTGITGAVTDNSGASALTAQITVKSSSGELHTATPDGTGTFTVLGLPPGEYDVIIALNGFKDFIKKAVVTSGALTHVDAILEPANAKGTSVDVTGGTAAQVDTGASDITETITEQEIKGVPLNGRVAVTLIALSPGVSNQTGQDEAKVGVVGSVKYSVNGGRVEYNTFDIDGSDVLNVGINGSSSTLVVYPSVDAVEEIKVLSSNYGAMYGRTASGTVLMTTKSGKSEFHGDAYYFGRNEFFNARNFFDETQGAPLYRRHDLGATIGGSVYIPGHYNTDKTKTFFFFSEEYRLEKSPQQYNQAVPSLAERAGNFSDVCPSSGAPFPRTKYPDCPALGNGGTGNVDPFPQNTLPFVDRNAAAILQTGIVPAPNSTSGCNSTISSCYVTTVSPETQWREELFRIDHNFNANTRATFRYIHDSWNTTVTTPQWATVQNSFPTVENNFIGPGSSLVARLTQTLSPTLVNDFIFSYVNSNISLTDENGPGATIQRPAALSAPCSNPDPVNTPNQLQCPIGYLFNNGFGGKIPGIVIAGTNGAYGGNGFAVDSGYMPWQHTNPVYTLGDSISKVIGKHNIQAGGQVILYHRTQTNGPSGAATGDLQGILRFVNQGIFSTGNAFADFLNHNGDGPGNSGEIQSFTQDSAQLSYSQKYAIAEPYIQDDWHVLPRLTLNLGLRISLFGNYRETNGEAFNWEQSAYSSTLASQTAVSPFLGYLLNSSQTSSPGVNIPLNLSNLDPRITNGLVHCGVNGVPASCMSGHVFNPAPRVGFAWDVHGDGKTSLRGGYGVFFEHGTGNEANTGSLEGSSPLVLNMTQFNPAGWGCIGATVSSCFPGSNVNPAFPLNVTSIPTKTIWPYAQQWSLSLQHELPSHMVATVAYVGSKGTHLTDERQINQLVPVSASVNPYAPGEPLIPTPLGPDALGFIQGDCSLNQGGNFVIQTGVTVVPGSPGFNNLQAACGPYNEKTNISNSLRTFAPGLGQIFALENEADSSYNSFQATLRRVEGPLTLGVSYTFSKNKDDSSDRSDANLINAYDLRSNWARSDYDQRNLLNVSYVWELPFTKFVQHPSDRLQQFIGGWELSGITVYQTGTPFSVINNGSSTGVSVLDNAGVASGTGAGSYPDLVSNPNYAPPGAGNNGRSFGPLLLNPGAFAAPQGLTFGNAGRNVLNNPGRTNFDIALLKHIKITENKNLELRFETFNTFNHTQFRIYDSNLGNTGSNTVSCYGGPASGYSAAGGDGVDCLTGSAFLHPVDAHRPRTIQYGIKFAF